MGMFDDLIAQVPAQAAPAQAAPAPASGGGMFDDLIAQHEAQGAREAAASRLTGHHYATPGRINTTPDTTNWQDFKNGAAQYGRGVAEGVTNTVAPFVNSAAASEPQGVTGAVQPPEQPETLQHVVGSRLPDPGEPQSRLQSMARTGGEFTGSAIPLFGAGTGLAKAGVRLGVEEGLPGIAGIFNKLKGGINAGLDSAAAKPVRTGLGEAVVNTEAGAGSDVARAKAQEAGYGETGQNVAGVAGGLVAPTALSYLWPGAYAGRVAGAAKPLVAAGAEKVAGAIPEKYVPEWLATTANKGREEQVATISKSVGNQLEAAKNTPAAKANIATAERVESAIPGFRPGIAEKTGDQNLLNTQAKLDTAAEGENLTKRQQAYDANTSAVSKYYDQVVPPVGKPFPEDSAAAAGNRRVGNIGQKIGQQETATRGALAEKSNLPAADRAAVGADLRGARGALKEEANTEVGRLRKNIVGADEPVELSPAKPRTNEYDPTDMGTPAEKMSVNQILDRRTEINQEMRYFMASPNKSPDDLKRAAALQAERTKLDDAIEKADRPGLPEYRNYYKNEYVPRFSEGASHDVGSYKTFGYDKNKVMDEDVAGKFFAPNNISEARQFNKLYGKDPAAKQRMSDYALDSLRTDPSVMGSDGILKEGGVAKWMQRHERVLNEMPWVREAVSARNPDELYGRLGTLSQRQRDVGGTKLSKVLASSSGPGKEPSAVIDAALKDHTLMRQLVNSTRGDEQSAAALRRGVFNRVRESAPGVLDSPEKFKEWLRGHNRSLSAVLTPEHLKSLNDVADAAAIMGRRARPEGASAIPKSIAGQISDAVGLTPGSAAASALSVARGRTNPLTEVMGQGLRVWNKQTERLSNAAWDEALSNPDMARTVATVVKAGKATPIQVHRMYTHLVSAGLVGGEEAGGGSEK